MAFEKISKRPTTRFATAPDYIGLSCSKAGGGKLTGRFVFGGAVMSQMDVRPKDRVDLARGTGEDAGLLRLSKGDSAGWAIQPFKNTSRGILTVPALAAKKPYKAAPVEYKIKDGTLYITLPEWARG